MTDMRDSTQVTRRLSATKDEQGGGRQTPAWLGTAAAIATLVSLIIGIVGKVPTPVIPVGFGVTLILVGLAVVAMSSGRALKGARWALAVLLSLSGAAIALYPFLPVVVTAEERLPEQFDVIADISSPPPGSTVEKCIVDVVFEAELPQGAAFVVATYRTDVGYYYESNVRRIEANEWIATIWLGEETIEDHISFEILVYAIDLNLVEHLASSRKNASLDNTWWYSTSVPPWVGEPTTFDLTRAPGTDPACRDEAE